MSVDLAVQFDVERHGNWRRVGHLKTFHNWSKKKSKWASVNLVHTSMVGGLGADVSRSSNFKTITDRSSTMQRMGADWHLVHWTQGEAETSGRQSVLVSPPEYSTIHPYKVWLESGTWEKKKRCWFLSDGKWSRDGRNAESRVTYYPGQKIK